MPAKEGAAIGVRVAFGYYLTKKAVPLVEELVERKIEQSTKQSETNYVLEKIEEEFGRGSLTSQQRSESAQKAINKHIDQKTSYESEFQSKNRKTRRSRVD